jgi:hypothetical protein
MVGYFFDFVSIELSRGHYRRPKRGRAATKEREKINDSNDELADWPQAMACEKGQEASGCGCSAQLSRPT